PEVDRLVGDVPVTTDDHLASGLREPRELRQEGIEEAELRSLPVRPARARRQVKADDREPAEIRLQVAALGIELGVTEAMDERRRRPRVEGNAGVAAACRRIERSERAARASERGRHVVQCALYLLHADDVPRVGAREPARKSL